MIKEKKYSDQEMSIMDNKFNMSKFVSGTKKEYLQEYLE